MRQTVRRHLGIGLARRKLLTETPPDGVCANSLPRPVGRRKACKTAEG